MVQQINLFLTKYKKMIKIGIIGVGYFGEIHLINLLKLNNKFDVIGIYDTNKERSIEISSKYQVKNFDSVELLINNSEAVDITCSTNNHFDVIKNCIEKNKHIFIEKPLSDNIEKSKEIVKLCENYKPIIQIGFIERFNDSFVNLLKLNFKINDIHAIRTGAISERNKNSCIIHDMMIHDIDIINCLIKSSINKISINKESTKDKVMCQITYNNNCKANITSERSKIITKNKSKRKIIINTLDQQKISLDLLNKKIFINEIEQEQKNENTNALVNELIYFYECINNKKTNNISIKSAYSAELISDQIKKKLNEIS